jgi:hypothetical protein
LFTLRAKDFADLVPTLLFQSLPKKLGTLEQNLTFINKNNDLAILNLEQNLEQVGTDLEQQGVREFFS